jgi:hypothetical protein
MHLQYYVNMGIYISADNEYAFREACNYDHFHIAQWLLKIKPTIIISSNYETALWLSKIKQTIMKFDYKNRILNLSKLYICCHSLQKKQWNLSEYIIQTICRFI